MKKLILLLICFNFLGCMDRIDNRSLLIKNNTADTIYAVMTQEDFSHYVNLNQMGILQSDSILPKEKYSRLGTRLWQDYIDMSNDKKMRLYIIQKDSINKYGWEGIHAKNLYNQKYTLDIDDLDSLNWTIEYNGN